MDRSKDALRKFGGRLKALRQQKKLTVKELAALAGLDPRRVERIEAGKVNLLFSTILALSRGLDLPPQELLESL